MATSCERVRAAGVAVPDLEDKASGAVAKVSAGIAPAKAENGVEAIVLGCAGMADLAAWMEAEYGLKAVDGVGAAAFAMALVNLRRG